MATYDTSELAGQIVPIMGMGISLGILTKTAKNITDTFQGGNERPRSRSRGRRGYSSQKRYPSYRGNRGFSLTPQNKRKPRLTIPLKPYRPRRNYYW